ncbi:two-component system, NtrC family, sensor kinase [Ferrimonas sediminum]|uniref:histidine kinase n=1 Tax=Ferrimonas sediminum TaxID=718193 RepID=A0A1G8JGZ8_9GAMM|nr:HAMP domain-containing sensor histidine kinase [Ferrimonas sediminum]SDI30323.1 two-component system, NtrC family, sensor kinase [Ferrimonas sediminum]
MLSSWRDRIEGDVRLLTSTVRYRLLVLMLLPVLLTLASLVFITIYWNVSYTGSQLFMKVRADLGVAQGVILEQLNDQEQVISQVQSAWRLKSLLGAKDSHGVAINQLLERNRELLGLDFLRLISLPQASVDPRLQKLIPAEHERARSGIQVLNKPELADLGPVLARQAQMPIQSTPMAADSVQGMESRGMVMRTLLKVKDTDGTVVGYLDGGVLLNRNRDMVDNIRDLLYAPGTLPNGAVGTVTLFLDNVRISTNVPGGNSGEQRAIGSLVSDQVKMKVLERGQVWIDRAFVFHDWYISAYAPLYDIDGRRIGMLYTGFTEAPFIHNYLLNILELGFILMVVLFLSGLAVYKGATGLLKPLDRIHTVVQAMQEGKERRIGNLGLDPDNELSQLARQFDRMLDLLQQRNREIKAAAEQLEFKVDERTRSLKQRTKELKENLKLLEETRAQMVTNEKLVALGELTAGIAHEINNPTAVILGNMELMKFELGDRADDVEEEIELVLQQVQRIKAIIQSLLQYARPGDFDAPLERQQINPIVEEMRVLVRHSIEKQAIDVALDLKADARVVVNSQQLLQVLINLVINASHAMEDRGQIRVSSDNWLDDEGKVKGVTLAVADTGVGIEPELLSRIFDPFFTTRKTGTGLGLALSYGIIRRFGGHIDVDSVLGEGTTFTIRLPSDVLLKEDALSVNLRGLEG